MLDGTSNMPEYQWKLTIVERNLLVYNWLKLIPEAQAQILWEVDELIGDLPLPERQRLLSALFFLQGHVEEDFQQKIQQIVSKYPSYDLRKILELSIQNTCLPTAV
jgi:hypothetical protein